MLILKTMLHRFLTVVLLSSVIAPALAQDPIVIIHGDRECMGWYTKCEIIDGGGGRGGGGRGSGGYDDNEGGGGGGGGGYVSNNNDGTTGVALDKNRFQPGCLGEQIFVESTLQSVILNGQPVGTPVDLELGDPLYNNGEWEKFQTETIQRSTRKGDPYTMAKRIRIHYMYNHVTNQVAQVKFKNSYQFGCEGISHAVGG
ncbi:hypothetical protein RBA41_07080 [Massilia sp. CCM 9210]|uniref:hypothetical protein n=1 Tax=Massilia scottii TaxID=3057166 RepID=UPI002796A5A9|nr:hypothetical protein [Massilia sp. CCM 9210]MDQ1813066.1 hypothetical protein [Massilia sp. CCM 9210]